jgi:hypothetical protein
MHRSLNLYKDIITSLLYFGGIMGLMSGEILISSLFILTASLISGFNFR